MKVGAGAVYERMENNDIQHCHSQGVYVLRVADDDDVNLEMCRLQNRICMNGNDTILERVQLQGGQLDGKLALERVFCVNVCIYVCMIIILSLLFRPQTTEPMCMHV